MSNKNACVGEREPLQRRVGAERQISASKETWLPGRASPDNRGILEEIDTHALSGVRWHAAMVRHGEECTMSSRRDDSPSHGHDRILRTAIANKTDKVTVGRNSYPTIPNRYRHWTLAQCFIVVVVDVATPRGSARSNAINRQVVLPVYQTGGSFGLPVCLEVHRARRSL